jgi:transposase
VGLTPTPYDSGKSEREQGISKAGNKQVRGLIVELAWLWLRWQPGSALSQWYERRFGPGKSEPSADLDKVLRRRGLETPRPCPKVADDQRKQPAATPTRRLKWWENRRWSEDPASSAARAAGAG